MCLSERGNPGGLFFGDEGITSLLAGSSHVDVSGLADSVMKDVADFAAGALADDTAIMALERVDGAPSNS